MQAPDELIKEWAELKEQGDNKILAKILKLNDGNVSRILNGGEGTVKRISQIKKFYDARKKEIEKLKAS